MLHNMMMFIGLLIFCCGGMVPSVLGSFELPELVEVYAELSARTENDATMERFKIQEYSDLRSSRTIGTTAGSTSIRAKNERTGKFVTYYSFDRTISRSLVTKFDEDKVICSLEDLQSWNLANMTKMINMLPENLFDKSQFMSAVGTVRLLLLAKRISHKLKLKYNSFDRLRKTFVDYYVASFDLSAQSDADPLKKQTIQVLVASIKPNNGQTFEFGSRYNLVKRPPLRIQILIMEGDSTKGLSSKEFFDSCESSFGITVDYFIVQAITDFNSLRSPTLGTNNPLTLPVGIGCSDHMDKHSVTLSTVQQFSGQYLVNGMTPSYIAYDEDTSTLRIDHWYTKTIYDFGYRALYNIDLGVSRDFSSNLATGTRDDDNFPDKEIRLCAVTPIDIAYTVNLGADQGLNAILGPIRYVRKMGTTEFDGLACDVYEVRLMSSLQPLIFGQGQLSKDRKYYIIIFVTTENGSVSTGRYNSNRYIGMIKRLELRSYESITREMQLLKWISFTSFSWSLDVSPLQSESLSNTKPVQIFDTPQCAPFRDSQLLMKFSIEPDASANELVSQKDLHALKLHSRLVEEEVMTNMVYRLRTPRFRITEMESKFLGNSIVISAKLLDAPRFIFYEKNLGFLTVTSEEDLPIATLTLNNINRAECITTAARRNLMQTMRYCPWTGMCYLYTQDYRTLFGDKLSVLDQIDSVENPSKCTVSEVVTAVAHDHFNVGSTLNIAKHIAKTKFTEKFSFKIPVEGATQNKRYSGNVNNLVLRRLDDLDEREALKNLYYIDSNQSSNNDKFHSIVLQLNKRRGLIFCQRACALERFCMSYSFCKNQQMNVCVLSSLALDKFNLNKLMIAQAKSIKQSTNQFRYVDERYPDQTFSFGHSDQCTLHKLDALNQFSSYTMQMVRADMSQLKQGYTIKSLEECAISSRKSLDERGSKDWSDQAFMYCPIQSVCTHKNQANAMFMPETINDNTMASDSSSSSAALVPTLPPSDQVSADDADNDIDNDNDTDNDNPDSSGENRVNIKIRQYQSCIRYYFDLEAFFTKKLDKRLRLIVNGKEATDSEQESVTRKLLGLTEQECSLECLYGDPDCVSYDFCKERVTVNRSCYLHHVRLFDLDLANVTQESPDYVEYTPIERKIYDATKKNNVVLVTEKNDTCWHYHLTKQSIAVKHFLQEYKQQKLGHLSSDEQTINDEMEKKSASAMDKMRDQFSKLIEKGKTHTTVGIQLVVFCLGVSIGAILVLYSGDISKRAVNLYEDFQSRRLRQTNGRQMSISGVTLTNNFVD